MRLKSMTCLFIVSLCLASCGDSPKTTHDHPRGIVTVKVQKEAGSYLPGTDSLGLASFFNIGVAVNTSSQIPVILLGKRRKSSERVDANPVAVFSYMRDSIINKYVVAIPTDEAIVAGQNYNEFMLNYPYYHQSIEQWFRTSCATVQCRNFTWDNTYKALIEISNEEIR